MNFNLKKTLVPTSDKMKQWESFDAIFLLLLVNHVFIIFKNVFQFCTVYSWSCKRLIWHIRTVILPPFIPSGDQLYRISQVNRFRAKQSKALNGVKHYFWLDRVHPCSSIPNRIWIMLWYVSRFQGPDFYFSRNSCKQKWKLIERKEGKYKKANEGLTTKKLVRKRKKKKWLRRKVWHESSCYIICPRLNYTSFFSLLIRDFGRRAIRRLHKKKLNFELLFPFVRVLKSLVKYMMYPRWS